MVTLSPNNLTWYAVHQPILFGADLPFYPSAYDTAADDGNGFTVFHKSALILTPYPTFSTRFYVSAGIYAGFHNITSYDSTLELIYTDTPFIGADPIFPTLQRIIYMVVPFGYRVYYGYPTQPDYLDIRAYHKPNGEAYINVGAILKNVFTITPPVSGFDDSMYTYFSIDYIALGEFKTLLDDAGLNINMFTGWIYTATLSYALNAAIAHSRLQSLVANNDFIADADPIFFSNCCNIFTKIINNRAFNYIICNETAGIGSMEIENDFIVS